MDVQDFMTFLDHFFSFQISVTIEIISLQRILEEGEEFMKKACNLHFAHGRLDSIEF